MNILRSTKKLISEYRKIFPMLLGLSFLEGFLSCLGITLFLPVIEFFIYEGRGNSAYGRMIFDFLQSLHVKPTLLSFSLFIILVFMLKTLISVIQKILSSWVGTKLYNKLRIDLIDATVDVDYNYFTTMQAGSICNAIQAESKKMVATLRNFMMVLVALVYVFNYILAAFLISWKLTVVFLAVSAIAGYFFNRINMSSMKKGIREVELANTINSGIIDTVGNLKYIKMISIKDKLFDSFMRNINSFSINLFKMHRNEALLSSPAELIAILSFFMILGLGFYIKVSIEQIVVVALLYQRTYTRISDYYKYYQNYLTTLPGFDWIIQLREDLKANKEKTGNIKINVIDDIIFDNVSFSYNKKNNVLENINLVIPKNKMVAIVGPSGSGKSTIVDLICGLLYPDKGSVYIGDKLLKSINKISYKKLIGYVPQQPFLFYDTIYSNITLKNSDFTKEDVINSAKTANANDFIEKLALGYNEIIGDRGVKLSGGERQRIVIARELLKKPQLLILDEATNAMDAETERKMQNTIDNLSGKTTIVVIAHRFSTIQKADVIYVVENGQIVDKGNFKQLLGKCEKFKDLYAIQSE